MVIRVLDHKYFVLRTIDSDDGLKQYVCRDLVDEESNIYRIVRIKHADVSARMLRYLADIEVEGSFRQLREYASEEDHLCIVMDCGSGDALPLTEKYAQEEPDFSERLEYIYKLLERLILSDVPAYFAVSGLSSERVKFTAAMDCSFDFDIHDFLEYENYGMNDVCERLADVVMDAFDSELRWNPLPDLTEFIKDLRLHRYSEYLDIFGDFKNICQRYRENDDARSQNNGFSFKLWDSVKNFAAGLKNLSAALLLILAVVYLVISIRNCLKPTAVRDVYSSIGDMQILGSGAQPSSADEASAIAGETAGGAGMSETAGETDGTEVTQGGDRP